MYRFGDAMNFIRMPGPGEFSVSGGRILSRAAIFIGLLALSTVLSPLMALSIAASGLPFDSDFLFFWPQLVLVPFGLVGNGYDHSSPLGYESAMYFALGFWVLIAFVQGIAWRNRSLRLNAIIAVPVAIVMVLVAHQLVQAVGFGPYLDGL